MGRIEQAEEFTVLLMRNPSKGTSATNPSSTRSPKSTVRNMTGNREPFRFLRISELAISPVIQRAP
jgi:hypothetical protein